MKRTINELLAYISLLCFAGACVWALGTDRCVASVTAMVVTCTCTVYFTGATLFEIYDEMKARRQR